jgi:tyrosine-protein phosphatase 2/3
VPVEANPEFEEFRRKSEQGHFDLSHGNLAGLSRPPTTRQQSTTTTVRQIDSPVSPRSSIPEAAVSHPQNIPIAASTARRGGADSFFDIPRYDSPASLSPTALGAIDHRNARLSLPTNNLHTPPSDVDRRPVHRSETLPESLHKDGPNMVSAQQFVTLLQRLPEDVLLLDLRVAPQYLASRIREALNLCIPTTLMKRPSFNTQKLRDTFALESDKEKFSHWRECSFIAVYDANSQNLKDAQNPINVLKKFTVEGWRGQGIILKGGFAEFSKTHPLMVERDAKNVAPEAIKSPLSISAPAQGAARVAGGCPMPTSKTAVNPFFNNIRQNMDLLDGVGQLPVTHPAEMSERAENALPGWLRKTTDESNKGKLIADKFLAIERAEQKRMQDALCCTVSYGSPRTEKARKVQVAGIEKGSKNRYNNIFPFDHSRVHLQDVAPGGCDYINASYVQSSYSNKRYIATQAPIPATFNDFWRLVWEQDARVIVMLTAESEGGQVKSHPYWNTGEYGPLKVKLFSEKRVALERNKAKPPQTKLKRPSMGQRRSTNPHADAEKNNLEDSTQRTPETSFIIVRHFTLSHSNRPFQPMREITQMQYTQWPDFGAPAHPQHLLALVQQTSRFVRGSASPKHPAAAAGDPVPQGQRPILVHCSAGCGRTGTFCTVDSVVDMLERQKLEDAHDRMEVDSEDTVHARDWLHRTDVDLIAKTVEEFRAQRLSMVQSLRQFVLCYESILDWVVEHQDFDDGVAGTEAERNGSHG